MNERMVYHLSAYHWIDAIEPPMERRINKLADRIVDALNGKSDNIEYIGVPSNYNKTLYRLIGQNVVPRAEFMGREIELQEIENSFANGSGSVFLTGMGGIGKSEIAKAYAKNHRDDYNVVIFANYESDLKHLIASDQTIPVENLARAVASGGQAETLDDYYERKMNAFPIPTKKSFDYFENFATFCWIQGNFELSEVYEKKLYQLSCEEWGEMSLHTGSAAVLNFGLYPQGYFQQLATTAIVVPGKEIGDTSQDNVRFLDNKRIEGTLLQC